jgi:Cdc6-like AAA superfamily ATPase
MPAKHIPERFKKLIEEVQQTNVVNSDVFSTTRPITPDIEYERKQIRQLLAPIERFISGGTREHILLYGPVGSGKSSGVQYYLSLLEQYHKGVDILYVNCKEHSNSYLIYKELVGVSKKSDRDTLKRMFQAKLNKKKHTKKIVVLDEVDHVKDEKFLLSITRGDEHKNVLLVMITRDCTYHDQLSDDLKSSLKYTYVIFPCYTQDEISIILKKRASIGLKEYNDAVIAGVARILQDDYESDIRLGITALPILFGSASLPEKQIGDVLSSGRINLQKEILRSLSKLKITILYIIYHNKQIRQLEDPWIYANVLEDTFCRRTKLSPGRYRQILPELLKSGFITRRAYKPEQVSKRQRYIIELNLDPEAESTLPELFKKHAAQDIR